MMSAIKDHHGKTRFDLVPTPAIRGIADAFAVGLKNNRKPFDWLNGADWSQYIAATDRHWSDFKERKDVDPDDGVLHIFKAMASLSILATYYLHGIGNDDRPYYKERETMELPRIGQARDGSRLRVYVAGSYSSDNVLGILDNMRRGIVEAKDVLLAGFAPYCPWLDHHYHLSLRDGETITYEDYCDYSMAWLEVSDAVLVLPNSENSKGTRAEIARAKELNIPIFGSLKALQQWSTLESTGK